MIEAKTQYSNKNLFYRREFTIVPTGDENLKNKSPVLYEENNLGLESWCIKHLYKYVYPELLESRRKKLSPQELANLNHLLIGALLINPDVYTFWNIKRELVEKEVLNVEKEFLFSKLVLSHKSKSNEAFSYRRWLITKILNKYNDISLNESLLRNELEVTEIAAERSQNNYHAINHRMWAFNIISYNTNLMRSFIVSELQWNSTWIFSHVSEHVGYHYRQFLIDHVKTRCNSFTEFENYYREVKKFLECVENVNYVAVLREVLGPWDASETSNNIISYVNHLSILLYDLFYTLFSLQKTFPDHESVWYYRRSVIYHIIVALYEILGVKFKSNRSICTNFNGGKNNFIESILSKDEIVETHPPKILKYEPNKVETTLLYTILVRYERNYLSTNCSNATYAERHRKWLQLFMEMYDL